MTDISNTMRRRNAKKAKTPASAPKSKSTKRKRVPSKVDTNGKGTSFKDTLLAELKKKYLQGFNDNASKLLLDPACNMAKEGTRDDATHKGIKLDTVFPSLKPHKDSEGNLVKGGHNVDWQMHKQLAHINKNIWEGRRAQQQNTFVLLQLLEAQRANTQLLRDLLQTRNDESRDDTRPGNNNKCSAGSTSNRKKSGDGRRYDMLNDIPTIAESRAKRFYFNLRLQEDCAGIFEAGTTTRNTRNT